MARTIQSPGVEINEIDLSLRPSLPVGTNIMVPGFANQGPVDELLQVSSISEFEQLYGLPTNAAERYFYHTVKAAFNSPANIFVARLPYGVDDGETVGEEYTALVYPVHTKPSHETIMSWADSTTPSLTAAYAQYAQGQSNLSSTNQSNDSWTTQATVDAIWDAVGGTGTSYAESDTYYIGEPEHVTLTESEYETVTNN